MRNVRARRGSRVVLCPAFEGAPKPAHKFEARGYFTPLNADTVWQGWGGAENGWIDVPAGYPIAANPPPCAKVLPGAFRFSWSYNPMLQQFILLGLVSNPANQPSCPAADPTVGQSDTAFVYMTATADLPNGRFTIVTPQTCLLRINWFDHWGRSWPDRIGKGLVFISLNLEPEAQIATLDGLRARLEAQGVPVRVGSWGYRVLVVDDPDGNEFLFNYPAETAHP